VQSPHCFLSGITKRTDLASSQYLPHASDQISHSVSGYHSGDDSLSPRLSIPASRAEDHQRLEGSPASERPSPILSRRTRCSSPTASSVLTSFDSSFFLETVPDSYENTDRQASLSAYSVLPSSPPFRRSFVPIPPTPLTESQDTSPPNTTDNTSSGLIREPATRSFIHFHGATSGTGSARRWSCSYCK